MRDYGKSKNKLCNDLIKSGLVKKGDVINHSYNCGDRPLTSVYIARGGIFPTLTTRPDTLGVVVSDKNSRKLLTK